MKTGTGTTSLSSAEVEGDYTGIDILEALQAAKNYNSYLTGLIRRWSESREVVDFGAGMGTFAKLLRQRGFSVLCIEPDRWQR
jgi:2-polyprenyl-3-methyl-5-hydroxy-6-metoxy-1,4-benzoquinol methylase